MLERFKRFYHLMLEEGVYLAPSAYEAGFLSLATATRRSSTPWPPPSAASPVGGLSAIRNDKGPDGPFFVTSPPGWRPRSLLVQGDSPARICCPLVQPAPPGLS